MSPFLACVRKELLLLLRDLHGLALLFLMPLAFVLVMSLAMQEQFAARAGKKVEVLVNDADGGAAALALQARIVASGAFALERAAPGLDIDAALRAGRALFALELVAGYGERLQETPAAGAPPLLRVRVAPDAPRQTELVFLAALREALGRQRVDALLEMLGEGETAARLTDAALASGIAVDYAYRGDGPVGAPSAVQQSVPAWLVFGVFFVAIPLSNTLIRERQFGTLRRLRSTNVSAFSQLAAKWVTYFGVNQLQVAAMLAAGVWLVPLLGGEALQLNGSPWALALVAAALSVAALGYALLIAVAARTTEQASLAGGAGNIILAAVGGIMVPKFVMPAAMQRIAELSPMAWGLDGFLDVLLRGGGISAVWPEVALLCGFGAAALLLAAWLLPRKTIY
jgi:ABC-2 type transport system permease protein